MARKSTAEQLAQQEEPTVDVGDEEKGVVVETETQETETVAEEEQGSLDLVGGKGQSEAGLSLGLRRRTLLRLIVLPQALRIMLPPMGNQYLNLAKNTSLGIAVAYPEIVAVGQTLYNQEGQTIAVFIIWMAFYSTISLTLSSIVNYYNRRMRIVER